MHEVSEQWQCSLHVFSHKSSGHRDFLQPSPHWFTSYVACRRHKGRLYYYWLGTPNSYPCWEFFQLEPTLFESNQHHPKQYIVCFLLFVDTPTPIQTKVIILHSYAHVHQCQSAPLRSWIQFQGCETLWGDFFPLMHYGGSFLFLCSLIWARRREVPWASVFTSSVWV